MPAYAAGMPVPLSRYWLGSAVFSAVVRRVAVRHSHHRLLAQTGTSCMCAYQKPFALALWHHALDDIAATLGWLPWWLPCLSISPYAISQKALFTHLASIDIGDGDLGGLANLGNHGQLGALHGVAGEGVSVWAEVQCKQQHTQKHKQQQRQNHFSCWV